MAAKPERLNVADVVILGWVGKCFEFFTESVIVFEDSGRFAGRRCEAFGHVKIEVSKIFASAGSRIVAVIFTPTIFLTNIIGHRQPVLRPVDVRRFVVLPKRRIVERTFAWLNQFRRLCKDFERNPDSSVAMIKNMLGIPENMHSNLQGLSLRKLKIKFYKKTVLSAISVDIKLSRNQFFRFERMA